MSAREMAIRIIKNTPVLRPPLLMKIAPACGGWLIGAGQLWRLSRVG